MVSAILSKEDCEKILHKFAGAPAQLQSSKICRFSEKVMGFLGEHYELKLVYYLKNETGENPKTITFFVKSLPQKNNNQKQYVNEMGVFKKELLMYKNLLSKFLTISSKPFTGQFYFANSECMVLEDLRLKSFHASSGNILSEDKCKSALEVIARFHAASLIFEESRSTKQQLYRIGDHFPEELKESTYSYVEGHPRNKWLITAAATVVQLLKYFTEDEKITKKLENFIFNDMPSYLLPSKKYRNVVTHDDLWNNNMLFNDKNECTLVDFQLTRYTPPALDVLLTLYINLEWSYLKPNISLLLNDYYESMEMELKRHNLDPEKVFPRSEFFESIAMYQMPALVETAMYGTNTLLPEHVSAEVVSNIETFESFTFKNRVPFIVKEYEQNEQYRKRFNNILVPLMDLLQQQ